MDGAAIHLRPTCMVLSFSSLFSVGRFLANIFSPALVIVGTRSRVRWVELETGGLLWRGARGLSNRERENITARDVAQPDDFSVLFRAGQPVMWAPVHLVHLTVPVRDQLAVGRLGFELAH